MRQQGGGDLRLDVRRAVREAGLGKFQAPGVDDPVIFVDLHRRFQPTGTEDGFRVGFGPIGQRRPVVQRVAVQRLHLRPVDRNHALVEGQRAWPFVVQCERGRAGECQARKGNEDFRSPVHLNILVGEISDTYADSAPIGGFYVFNLTDAG